MTTEANFMDDLKSDFPDFKISLGNLANPTSDFVMSYYTMLYESITTLDNSKVKFFEITETQRDFINSYQPEGSSFLHHIRQRNLYLSLAHIFNQISLRFHYCDLLCPERTPKRTFVFMSTLLSLHAYCNQFDGVIHDAYKSCEAEIEEFSQHQTVRDNLIQEINETENARTMYKEGTKELQQKMKDLSVVNEEKVNALKKLQLDNEVLKQELLKSNRKQEKDQEMFLKLQDEKKRLQSLIVSDQNQIVENHANRLAKKEECTRKLNLLKLQSDGVSKKGRKFDNILIVQKKLDLILKKDNESKLSDFKSLYETISQLNKDIASQQDEESVVTFKLNEAEEIIPKLKAECLQLDNDQAQITLKGRGRIGILSEHVESQKKSFHEVNKKFESEAAASLISESEAMNNECVKIYKELQVIDDDTQRQYETFIESMMTTMNKLNAKFIDKS